MVGEIHTVHCEVNKVQSLHFRDFRGLTSPDLKTLGASPYTKFLANAGSTCNSLILDMLPYTGAGVILLSEKLIKDLKIEINTKETHLYKIRDASEKQMAVSGTVKLQVIQQGSCTQYTLRAIVTSSMMCKRGLLGYPDMGALGMLKGSFPIVTTHECTAKVNVGAPGFPKRCSNSFRNEGEASSSGGKRKREEQNSDLVKKHKKKTSTPNNSIYVQNLEGREEGETWENIKMR